MSLDPDFRNTVVPTDPLRLLLFPDMIVVDAVVVVVVTSLSCWETSAEMCIIMKSGSWCLSFSFPFDFLLKTSSQLPPFTSLLPFLTIRSVMMQTMNVTVCDCEIDYVFRHKLLPLSSWSGAVWVGREGKTTTLCHSLHSTRSQLTDWQAMEGKIMEKGSKTDGVGIQTHSWRKESRRAYTVHSVPYSEWGTWVTRGRVSHAGTDVCFVCFDSTAFSTLPFYAVATSESQRLPICISQVRSVTHIITGGTWKTHTAWGCRRCEWSNNTLVHLVVRLYDFRSFWKSKHFSKRLMDVTRCLHRMPFRYGFMNQNILSQMSENGTLWTSFDAKNSSGKERRLAFQT